MKRLRGPQFDAVWAGEVGCAAVDKATNEPNRFVDLKSSESGLPRASNGIRDDYIQMQYLRAIYGHYKDAAMNPVSRQFRAVVGQRQLLPWSLDQRAGRVTTFVVRGGGNLRKVGCDVL